MTNEAPHVSVIIPHKGHDEPLVTCLLALRRQTYPKDSFEVIVVRNEAEDMPPPLELERHEAFLWQPRGFSYAARNLGIQNAKAPLLALTDSDTIPSPEWLEAGVRCLQQYGVDLVAGKIVISSSGGRKSLPEKFEFVYGFDQAKNTKGGVSTTANLFATRAAFEKLGLFDFEALSGEDFSWTKKAVLAGAKLTYCPSSVVAHPPRTTWADLFSKARRTVLPFALNTEKSKKSQVELAKRLRFQVTTKPDHSRLESVGPKFLLEARIARLFLIIYKVLCLFRLISKFRAELRMLKSSRVWQ